ncbi:MAG: XisH family protein [Akkermansiaceae bacterium]|nr:XisH family protein [Armatimonadota bacterium]
MPALDRYHEVVRNALMKDGWTITDDPLTIRVGKRKLFADLGAERVLSAEKGTRKIAVEVKTFRRVSTIEDLQDAVGQFVVYRDLLAETDSEREAYVAVPDETLDGIFTEEIGKILLRRGSIRVFGYDIAKETITKWLP